MSDPKFTPGPWEAHDTGVFAGRDCIAVCDTDNATDAVYRANAHMMAAAPELLASLVEVREMLWGRPDITGRLRPLMGFAEQAIADRAQAAINKALGEPADAA